MIVIFPADELLLMTYGAAAIPRISPRPTLDCLREPKVPIVYPAHFKTSAAKPATATTTNPSVNHIAHKTVFNNFQLYNQLPVAEPKPEPEPEFELPLTPPAYTYDNNSTPQSFNLQSTTLCNSLPPTPPRTTPRSSLKRSIPVTPRRGSTRQITFSAPSTPAQPNLPHAVQFNYEYPIMQQQQSQYSSESGTASPGLRRGMMEGMGASLGSGISNYNYQLMDRTRSRSPSILVEPATPTQITDPTLPIYGSGWGRPMSPMDLPPEPSKSPTGSTNRSRLRPKLHIPRLGRSSSSDRKESSRLKEDLHLQVENPIFNSENLRQRNFDAFFESGEPVYKLHPTTPASAPADAASLANYSPPALAKCAGVYDSSPRGQRATTGGGLFAKSPNEGKFSESRSKSVDKYENSARDIRAASVSADGGGGVPQKGDRCLKKTIFHKIIYLFTVIGFSKATLKLSTKNEIFKPFSSM